MGHRDLYFNENEDLMQQSPDGSTKKVGASATPDSSAGQLAHKLDIAAVYVTGVPGLSLDYVFAGNSANQYPRFEIAGDPTSSLSFADGEWTLLHGPSSRIWRGATWSNLIPIYGGDEYPVLIPRADPVDKPIQEIEAAETINWSLTPKFYKNMTASVTFAFSEVVNGGEIEVILKNTGSFTSTWPGNVVWAGGTAPTLTPNKVDIFTFRRSRGIVYGSVIQNF